MVHDVAGTARPPGPAACRARRLVPSGVVCSAVRRLANECTTGATTQRSSLAMTDTPAAAGRPPQPIPESHRDLFEGRAPAHLATVMPNGAPQVTPVWVMLDDQGYVIV